MLQDLLVNISVFINKAKDAANPKIVSLRKLYLVQSTHKNIE
jgi:hypothetical protein